MEKPHLHSQFEGNRKERFDYANAFWNISHDARLLADIAEGGLESREAEGQVEVARQVCRLIATLNDLAYALK